MDRKRNQKNTNSEETPAGALFMPYRSLRYEPDEPVDGVVFLPLIARS
jgi:hypothetical protein